VVWVLGALGSGCSGFWVLWVLGALGSGWCGAGRPAILRRCARGSVVWSVCWPCWPPPSPSPPGAHAGTGPWTCSPTSWSRRAASCCSPRPCSRRCGPGERWPRASPAPCWPAPPCCRTGSMRGPPPAGRRRNGVRLLALNLLRDNEGERRPGPRRDHRRGARRGVRQRTDARLARTAGAGPGRVPAPLRAHRSRLLRHRPVEPLAAAGRDPRAARLEPGDPRRRGTPHGPLGVLGVHTPRPGNAARNADRDQALAAIPAAVRGLPAAHVVLGDCNATPWTPSLRDLLADGSLRAATFTPWLPTWPTAWPMPLRIPIDHALLGPGLDARRSRRRPVVRQRPPAAGRGRAGAPLTAATSKSALRPTT
jgi:hypothetical protein